MVVSLHVCARVCEWNNDDVPKNPFNPELPLSPVRTPVKQQRVVVLLFWLLRCAANDADADRRCIYQQHNGRCVDV